MTEPSDLSRLPQVDALLQHDGARAAVARHGHRAFADAVRSALDEVRAEVREGAEVPDHLRILNRAVRALDRSRARRLRRVINATGVVLHTNLGRAPLSAPARQAVLDAAGYTTLEYDLEEGDRGSRTTHVGELAAEACRAEAATVVNNGAAALVLVLAALARDRDVIVSRGELVEIGGSYRLPDIMEVSGARMREVGTTNRTRIGDYRAVIGPETGLLLKVHQSNYRMVGFTESASVSQLADLGREHDVPLVHDLGSGLLVDAEGPLASEPSVARSVSDGADLVIVSGDKLLGGPQAGIIAGDARLVRRCVRHPLARAFRIDKLQRAALEATLESHLRNAVPTDVPTWAMLSADLDGLEQRARAIAEALGDGATPVPTRAVVGGGAVPGVELDSWGVALANDDEQSLAGRLRAQDPPVIARVEDGRVVLDLRTVAPAQDHELVALVRGVLG